MAVVIRRLLSFALVAMLPPVLFAQDESAAMKEAIDALDEMAAEVSEFVGDIRFDERDVRSLIDLWGEYSQFGGSDEDEGDTIDFTAVLEDSEYRRWAASHNLDAHDWMRKTVRITMALYRVRMLRTAEMMPDEMAQQIEMIEQQREELGEEVYQQIRQGMEATAQYSKTVMETTRRLPEPTAAEKAILEKYRDELSVIMESSDEDEGYGEYGEYEEYEEYEEYDD